MKLRMGEALKPPALKGQERVFHAAVLFLWWTASSAWQRQQYGEELLW